MSSHRDLSLNQQAAEICRRIVDAADRLRVAVHRDASGARLIDCGIGVSGGLEAGRLVAEVCLAGLGEVGYGAGAGPTWPGPTVTVRTDHPLAACMASQYAGWRIAREGYFAMGSGPMRAMAAKEPLFETLGPGRREPVAVGVLETSQLPPDHVCRYLAEACGLAPPDLTLLAAPTASQAGSVQVVARSVETALHKLFELGFDLTHVESGFGVAPLAPVAGDALTAMGRTNDAILYGAEVTLWVRGDPAGLERLGPRVPSSASPSHGLPFAEIFDRQGRDFYRIDPMLFGPAVITFCHLDTGRSLRFGRSMPEVLQRSFGLD